MICLFSSGIASGKDKNKLTFCDKEVEKKCLAVRTRAGKVKFEVKLADFLKQLEEERKGRK